MAVIRGAALNAASRIIGSARFPLATALGATERITPKDDGRSIRPVIHVQPGETATVNTVPPEGVPDWPRVADEHPAAAAP